MNEDDVISVVLDRLESLGIEYMLVGSYASNTYGRPRSSFDADIVVRIPPDAIDRFLRAFEPDFVVEPEAFRASICARTMLNLIPKNGIFKVDMIPVRPTPFAEGEFARRRQLKAIGRTVWMASPEDVVLFKLEWYRRGNSVSARQLEDARDVYALQKGALDEAYLDHWAGELGVRDLLDAIRGPADGVKGE